MAAHDGNRFKRGILSGEIGSVADLKTAFKAEAKRTHPDLGERSDAAEFVRVRREYEAALAALSGGRPRADRDDAAGGASATAGSTAADPFAALELLLKRGFPKRPRHVKETLRYAYARLIARSSLLSLNPELPALFDAFEAWALSPAADPRAIREALRLLAELAKARLSGAELLEESVRMELARLAPAVSLGAGADGADPRNRLDGFRLDPAAADFLSALAERGA